jgi:hypothetical protein
MRWTCAGGLLLSQRQRPSAGKAAAHVHMPHLRSMFRELNAQERDWLLRHLDDQARHIARLSAAARTHAEDDARLVAIRDEVFALRETGSRPRAHGRAICAAATSRCARTRACR